MVHKKSEYNLQFHFMPKDLRHQIWQENIKARESWRSVNQAHHYWSYQVTNEPCDCDEVRDGNATVPEGKQGEAAAECEQSRKNAGPHGEDQELVTRKLKSSSVRQVQLKEPDEYERTAREVAVQTPDWAQAQADERNNCSYPELHHLMENLSMRGDSGKEKAKQSCESLAGSQPLKTPPLHRSFDFVDMRPSAKSCAQSGAEPLKRSTPTCFSSPTRENRKYFFKERKSPFASYGWNDDVRNIGGKKTYNVNAPETQVHSPALRAQSRRHKDMLRYLAREADRRRCSESVKSPANLSSSWMSEYQDKYCQGCKVPQGSKITRPVSAPLFRSSHGWRYS